MAQPHSINLAEMSAAPTLPKLDDTPDRWTPAELFSRPEDAAAESGETNETIDVLLRAAILQRSFVSALANAQTAYLTLMSEIGQGFEDPFVAESETIPEGDAALATAYTIEGNEIYVDLHYAPWLRDHRPDYGAAVLPMTCVAEIAAASAQALVPGKKVVGLTDLTLRRWIVVTDTPLRIRREIEPRPNGTFAVTLLIWREAQRAELSRDEVVASAIVQLADDYPAAPPAPEPMTGVVPSANPYESASLFHGPAFQLIRTLWSGREGAGADIDASATTAPQGAINPVLIDTILQAGADMRWADWCPEAQMESGKGLPLKLAQVTFYGPTPRGGDVRSEMRAAGLDGGPRFPVLDYFAFAEGRMWMSARLVVVGSPLGPFDAYPPLLRRAHLRDRAYVPNVHLSTFTEDETSLRDETLALANWIPGTIEIAYDIAPGGDTTRAAALKEHAARLLSVHPAEIILEGDTARCAAKPGTVLTPAVTREGGRVSVRGR